MSAKYLLDCNRPREAEKGSGGAKRKRTPTPRRPAYLRARARTGVLFISPALTLFCLFLVGPILGALILSFTNFNVYAIGNWLRASFVGIANYRELLFEDPLFWISLRNTFYCAWRGVGFNMLIFLAGLQGIPNYFYEAAAIDGANTWAMFRYITLPLLRPTTLLVTVMTLIGHIQLFEEPFIMTGGGPLNATLPVAMYIYRLGFRFFRLGYASSLAYVLFLIIFVMTLIRMKIGRSTFDYAGG